ncbi:MAG: peptidoglycan DD-metalloendopeptidase family protein [Solirubrobacteraceae bacterium]|nr:peptidoglycan DD-metalloendopeptidase family protein [Solirubrobacteraceae bacterium]
MPTPALRHARPLLLLGLAALVAVAVALAPAAPVEAQQAKLDELRGKIGSTQGRIDKRKSRERVLTADIQRQSAKVQGLQGRISTLQSRQNAVQADLDRSEAVLSTTQSDLRRERARLTRLRKQLTRAREVLSARLVELYTADRPSLVSIVLNSDGFADLLERGEFLRRIGRQDQRIVAAVRDARTDAIATEKRLASLESRQRAAARRIEGRRDEIAQVKGGLVSAQQSYAAARDRRKALLKGVRSERQHLEKDLAAMQREESKIQAKLSGMPSGGPVRQGGGRLAWPANGQFTSPFGQRWGRLHAGIDIAVPTGTAVHASESGTVAIAGWVGGYGNYICINHGGGLSTCYAHNSRLGVSVGQKVSKGQVIAASGNTGNSTGPHIHFETRVGGVPRDPMGYL